MKKVIILGFVIVLFLAYTAQASQPTSKKQAILDAIEKLRTGENDNIRYQAGLSLSELTRGAGLKDVDDRMIAKMVSLLDISEASPWVAASLGNLGSRAKIAVPKLYQILAEEDCLHVSLSGAAFIRPALKRIGFEAPPPKCED